MEDNMEDLKRKALTKVMIDLDNVFNNRLNSHKRFDDIFEDKDYLTEDQKKELSQACSLRLIDISVGLKSDLHDIKDWLRAIKSELK